MVSGAPASIHLGQWRETPKGKTWHQLWRTLSWLLLKVLSQRKSSKGGFLAHTLQSSDERVWESIAVLQPNQARASASCVSFCSAAPTNIALLKGLLKSNIKIYSYYQKLFQLIKKEVQGATSSDVFSDRKEQKKKKRTNTMMCFFIEFSKTSICSTTCFPKLFRSSKCNSSKANPLKTFIFRILGNCNSVSIWQVL